MSDVGMEAVAELAARLTRMTEQLVRVHEELADVTQTLRASHPVFGVPVAERMTVMEAIVALHREHHALTLTLQTLMVTWDEGLSSA